MEEPLIPEDLEGHIQLRQAVPFMPIATGEDHHTRVPFRQLMKIAASTWCNRTCTGAGG